MIFSDFQSESMGICPDHLIVLFQRYSRADKKGKLPKWIQENLKDSLCNLSTEEAVQLSNLIADVLDHPNDAAVLERVSKEVGALTTRLPVYRR